MKKTKMPMSQSVPAMPPKGKKPSMAKMPTDIAKRPMESMRKPKPIRTRKI